MRMLVLTFIALVAGCDVQPPANAALTAQLAATTQRVGALEVSLSALEQKVNTQQQSPPGKWTLWQVSEAINAPYPQALSAYASKGDCLSAAGSYTYPGGKTIASDPVIVQFKGYFMRLECLPVGVNPYAK